MGGWRESRSLGRATVAYSYIKNNNSAGKSESRISYHSIKSKGKETNPFGEEDKFLFPSSLGYLKNLTCFFLIPPSLPTNFRFGKFSPSSSGISINVVGIYLLRFNPNPLRFGSFLKREVIYWTIAMSNCPNQPLFLEKIERLIKSNNLLSKY